jgi:2-oxoglutarate ferredoxin oxidoreductase subunit alpha
MVFGAATCGVRAMTSSSSPGISLKQEGISYLAGCQLPSVIVNVMRGGPGLGNISPSQSDYFQATKGGGHGDYRVIVLAPYTVEEAFRLTVLAFDLADTYRNPVLVLTDAFLGQMAEPISLKVPQPMPRVKKDWALTGAKNRAPNLIRSLLLKERALEEHNLMLQKKYRAIERKEVRYQSSMCQRADILCVAYGISYRIVLEAARILTKQTGIKIGLFRPVSVWPFPYKALRRASENKKAVFVFELSGGQMVEDVKLATRENLPLHFYGRMGGGVFTEKEVVGFIKRKLKRM